MFVKAPCSVIIVNENLFKNVIHGSSMRSSILLSKTFYLNGVCVVIFNYLAYLTMKSEDLEYY